MLAREVLRLRGTIYNRETPWEVMVDLYFCMSPLAKTLPMNTLTNDSQTAIPRPRPRRRSRRRSSLVSRRRARLPSSPATLLPLATGRPPLPPSLLPPLVSGARPSPFPGSPAPPPPLASGLPSHLRMPRAGRRVGRHNKMSLGSGVMVASTRAWSIPSGLILADSSCIGLLDTLLPQLGSLCNVTTLGEGKIDRTNEGKISSLVISGEGECPVGSRGVDLIVIPPCRRGVLHNSG